MDKAERDSGCCMKGGDGFRQVSWEVVAKKADRRLDAWQRGKLAPLSPFGDVRLASHSEGFKVVGSLPTFLVAQAFQTCLYLNEKEQSGSFINALFKK